MFHKIQPHIKKKHRDHSALPKITGNDLGLAIDNYHKARQPINDLHDSKGIKNLIKIYNDLDNKDNRLSTNKLLDVILILIRTNPAEDIVTSGILSELLGEFDGRVLTAIKGVEDIAGLNKGECLVNCLNLMCANPNDALNIALAKSLLHVLFASGLESTLLNQYYNEMDTNVGLARDIFLAVKTLKNFCYLETNPGEAEDYFRTHMPSIDNTSVNVASSRPE